MFAACSVTNVRIVEERGGGRPKGFGYAEFATLDGLKEALKLNNSQFQGRNIRVSVAEPRKLTLMSFSGSTSNGVFQRRIAQMHETLAIGIARAPYLILGSVVSQNGGLARVRETSITCLKRAAIVVTDVHRMSLVMARSVTLAIGTGRAHQRQHFLPVLLRATPIDQSAVTVLVIAATHQPGVKVAPNVLKQGHAHHVETFQIGQPLIEHQLPQKPTTNGEPR